VHLQIMDRPHAVPTDAGTQLVYELHLANLGDSPVRLRRLEVVDDSDGRVVASFTGSALEDRFSSLPADSRHVPVLAPRGRGVLYLEWRADARRPGVLGHVLTYAVRSGVEVSLRGGRTPVSYAAGAPLGPPLRGGPWIAIHYAGWPKGHRRVFTHVGDKARIPGRFAIDWVRVDSDGRLAHGDPDVPANALGYGAPVLAVGDATVAAVRDGMPEAARVSANPPHALPDEAGNYVVLRLADGRYAFYEHLRPGSTTVRPGQRVQRGDVLGALGFTGSSTGPHLHFHVADGPSPIGEEGRPFVLDGFDLLGRYTDPAKLGSGIWSPPRNGEATHRSDEWPAENAVVRFPD
jgi:murein DD-endopeptidase MepM/ murein hydrolase activator NlpD